MGVSAGINLSPWRENDYLKETQDSFPSLMIYLEKWPQSIDRKDNAVCKQSLKIINYLNPLKSQWIFVEWMNGIPQIWIQILVLHHYHLCDFVEVN